MKKKYFSILLLCVIFITNIRSVFAQQGNQWVSPFPIEVEILPITFPEEPLLNKFSRAGFKYNVNAVFQAGERVTLVHIENLFTDSTPYGCYIEGISSITNEMAYSWIPCFTLKYVSSERDNQITFGGLTIKEFYENILGPTINNYSFSQFVEDNGKANNYQNRHSCGLEQLEIYMNDVIRSSAYITTFLNNPIKEPGTPAYEIQEDRFTMDEYAYIIENDSDYMMSYDLSTGTKTIIQSPNSTTHKYNIIWIPPHAKYVFFHMQYDASDQRDYEVWEYGVKQYGFPAVLSDILMYSPNSNLFYYEPIGIMENSRTSYEIIGYYDPVVKTYDLFIPIILSDDDLPIWFMYAKCEPTIDSEGNDQTLQVWEYEDSDFVNLPPYIFSDGYFGTHTVAEYWKWIIVREGFNEYLHSQVSKMLP